MYKRLNFFLTSVLIVLLFFNLPANNKWLFDKIITADLPDQFEHTQIEERRMSRFGYPYWVLTCVVGAVKVPPNAVILLPPNKLLVKRKITEFRVPEPAVFYYYTGLNSVWANSPDVGRANWQIVANSEKDIKLREIPNRATLDSLINAYKRYLN